MTIAKSLERFDHISLGEMDEVELLNRTDTKYLLSLKDFEALLNKLPEHYKILVVEGKKISSYKTSYLDTEEMQFFKDHAQGKTNRHKVRYRTYLESGISFLEVKLKSKGRTKKKRVPVENFSEINAAQKKFLKKWIPQKASKLMAKLDNSFERITLVNKKEPERLTIDLNLSFVKNSQTKELSEHVILELKQEQFNRRSFILTLLKEKGIRPLRISKYMIGHILFDKKLKYNRFKSKLLELNKINHIWNS